MDSPKQEVKFDGIKLLDLRSNNGFAVLSTSFHRISSPTEPAQISKQLRSRDEAHNARPRSFRLLGHCISCSDLREARYLRESFRGIESDTRY